MSEIQFLAAQRALGNLILVQGTGTSGTVAISYTPPMGKKYTHVAGSFGSSGSCTATLRNNGTVVDMGVQE